MGPVQHNQPPRPRPACAPRAMLASSSSLGATARCRRRAVRVPSWAATTHPQACAGPEPARSRRAALGTLLSLSSAGSACASGGEPLESPSPTPLALVRGAPWVAYSAFRAQVDAGQVEECLFTDPHTVAYRTRVATRDYEARLAAPVPRDLSHAVSSHSARCRRSLRWSRRRPRCCSPCCPPRLCHLRPRSPWQSHPRACFARP